MPGRDRKRRGGIDVIRMRMRSGRTFCKLGIGSYGRDIMNPLRSSMVHLRYVQVVGLK